MDLNFLLANLFSMKLTMENLELQEQIHYNTNTMGTALEDPQGCTLSPAGTADALGRFPAWCGGSPCYHDSPPISP